MVKIDLNNKIKKDNVYVTPFLKGTQLYRGDSNFYNVYDKENLLSGRPYLFFGLTPEEVSEYGVTFQFNVLEDLYLVRLDDYDSREYIYNNSNPKIQKILRLNYGHNEKEERYSEENSDYEMSKYICEKYDGYITDKMKTDMSGSFHREIMVCLPENKLSFVKKITNNVETKKIQDEYRLKLDKIDRANTKKNKRKNRNINDNVFENMYPIENQGLDSPVRNLSYDSPVRNLSYDSPVRNLSYDSPVRNLSYDSPVGKLNYNTPGGKNKRKKTKKTTRKSSRKTKRKTTRKTKRKITRKTRKKK
jgi:hypothetical protein